LVLKQIIWRNSDFRTNELKNLKQTAEVNFGNLVLKKMENIFSFWFFDDLILFRSELVIKEVEWHNSKKIFGRLYF
jgi:hypothetical protein